MNTNTTTYTDTQNETQAQVTNHNKLAQYREMLNIADDDNGADLNSSTLAKIGDDILTGISQDEGDRTEWVTRYDAAIKNAMQEKGTKNYPFDNASNVKFPLIASAAQQFHARAYGAIIKGKDIVKGKVLVPDPDKKLQQVADAIASHMSNQLLEQMIGWVDGLDKTLGILPITGCVFKKTYYSNIKRMNVSEYITAKDVIIKYDSVSVEDAPRVTHVQTYCQNDIVGFVRSGEWRKCAEEIIEENKDDYDYYECHTWYDLDGDGYAEPYIVTLEKDSGKVVRMISRYDMLDIEANDKGEIIRIKAIDYFTRFIFLTSPDGGIYGMGFGTLLGAINDTVDTIINQLIDAGTLSNVGGGFISSKLTLGKKRQQSMQFKQNEWQVVDFGSQRIQDAILPLPVKEPSGTLYALLGLMIDTGRQLSSVTELMTGESRGANESPTTIMALIEQGTMVFTAIYKRIYQSLKSEFKKVYRLNRLYLTENPDLAELYRNERFGIVPIADPQDATNTQKIAKANALMQLIGQGLNDMEIRRRYLEAIDTENIEEIMKAPPAEPNPVVEMEMERLKMEQVKLNLETDKQMFERQKHHFEVMKSKTDTLKTVSETILNIAKAEAQELGPQLEQYKQQALALGQELEVMYEQQGGLSGMEGQQNNAGGIPANQPATIPNDGGILPGVEPENAAGGSVEPGNGYPGEVGGI